MAEFILSQTDADSLLAIEKHRVDDKPYKFPVGGQNLSINLNSFDKRELFILDIYQGRLNLAKVKFQNRVKQVIILVRLDIDSSPHRNPDNVEISKNHIHLYKEGYGDKWAYEIPSRQFPRINDIYLTLDDFMKYCNITKPPYITKGLTI